ncbi:MAG: hypothetical protein IJE83_06640, partial [Oscillospiraceae bacterium]|nr:hypothetical protein [Oscillospiraceae bacterium]
RKNCRRRDRKLFTQAKTDPAYKKTGYGHTQKAKTDKFCRWRKEPYKSDNKNAMTVLTGAHPVRFLNSKEKSSGKT